MPWAYYHSNFLRSFACAFDWFKATAGRIPTTHIRKIWVVSGLSSPRWDQKLILPPEECAYCSAAIKDGEESSMKISKNYSKNIQRTLRSGKNCLRYSLSSVISRVKWLNLRAWPNLWAHFEPPTHIGNTRQCVQKNVLDKSTEMDRNWFRSTKLIKDVQFSFEKISWNFFLLPESQHFSRETTISEN